MAHRDVEQLKRDYPDPEWQSKYSRICDLIEILADCTIADNYTISDALNSSIHLTQVGKQICEKLITKENVQPKEARLMCALSVGHAELFIDVENTDIDKMADAIGGEFSRDRIRFPFIFGRELYDRYAELYEEEKDSLTAEETLKLFDGLPRGVFQYGHYTLGPFGLREAPTVRNVQAMRQVPAYHCSRGGCRSIHAVLLETSHAAPINRDREKLETVLRLGGLEPAEWWPFAAEIGGLSAAHYGDHQSAILLPLIGDALALPELRLLVADLLDNTRGQLREAIASFLKVKAADKAVADLGRAELLQISLFAFERDSAASLDRLVREGKIVVPRGDVRRAVTTRRIASGAFRLRAELGSLGVRFAAEDRGFALLRERRLLDRLYVRDAGSDDAELDWQLRGVDVDDLDERLDFFFQNTEPRRILERMALARRTNMIATCEEVGLDDYESLSDQDLIDTLMWKLGFEVGIDADPHREFWTRHEQLWALTQSSELGKSGRFLESASPYFTRLEGLLLESLAFTAWALTVDHTTSELPFSYDDDEDRKAGLALMESIAPNPSGVAVYTADRVDLSSLISGFSALGHHLARCAAAPEKYRRPASELPEFDGKTTVKSFLLRSTIPFIDLTPPSRERVVSGLTEITRLLSEAEVNLVRNDYSHYRRTAPDISRIEAALEATRQAVTRIETLGFCRLLFFPQRVTRDASGRSFHDFSGPRSYEHRFSRPTRFDWMGLPDLGEPVYLMRSASIGEPSEVLRFVPRHRSAFSEMWAGYPTRRRRPRTQTPEQPEDHGSRVEVHDR